MSTLYIKNFPESLLKKIRIRKAETGKEIRELVPELIELGLENEAKSEHSKIFEAFIPTHKLKGGVKCLK